MTSSQESSKRPSKPQANAKVESLGGHFHPHAIEVQDFSYYALVIDVRTRSEYEDDHIPGAVQFSPMAVHQGPLFAGNAGALSVPAFDSATEEQLPPALSALIEPLRRDQAILVYCGRGGLDSLPVARALRWRGWSVDVLGGGWINYRRWVQAGLETLPRMLTLRLISTSLSCEADRVLGALTAAGQQVLDIEALAVWRRGSLMHRGAPQPPQALFESYLLRVIRTFDARRPVWVAEVDARIGERVLPGAMRDAIQASPRAVLVAPIEERARLWLEVEPGWQAPSLGVVDAMANADSPPDAQTLESWTSLADKGAAELAAAILVDHFDRQQLSAAASNISESRALVPLVADSLDTRRIAAAVKAWLPVSS